MRDRAYKKFRNGVVQAGHSRQGLQALVGNLPGGTAAPDSEPGGFQRGIPAEPRPGSDPLLLKLVSSRRIYDRLKRGIDFILSLLALTLFGLFLPFIALAIKLDSPGRVFFSQERVGMNRRRGKRRASKRGGQDRRKVLQPGRPFRIYKLRTMRVDAEANGPQWAKKQDARVTRVGRFLRMTRLDEVPQFINVLRGEMSLIGPRPERLCFVRQLEKNVPKYRDRLLVLPGITGLAQVRNGYDENAETVRRKVALDRKYIRKSGFWEDLKIMIHTVKVVITGEGAQ